jgi:hypothetical protein
MLALGVRAFVAIPQVPLSFPAWDDILRNSSDKTQGLVACSVFTFFLHCVAVKMETLVKGRSATLVGRFRSSGMTQNRMAELSGYDRVTICGWLSGKSKVSVRFLDDIQTVLDGPHANK